MQTPMVCRHYYISGRVQGVWYRATAQKLARDLQLTGWAKNLPDGRVEILACGDETALDQLEVHLWQKPRLAKVTNIIRETMDFQHFDDFSIVI